MLKKIRNRFFYATFLILLLSKSTFAQNKDTVLNTLYSNPYFFNLIQLNDGKVLAGTSGGIVEINGTELRQVDSRIGYVGVNKEGKPSIDSTGIFYYSERKYLHLLPYPELAREEFHASQNNKFYICSGGRLYIFDIVLYKLSYPFHSVRSISQDAVGTYSGIYLRGKKLNPPVPNYTDGYIRQFDDRIFICSYGLSVLEKEVLETGTVIENKNFFVHNFTGAGFVNDIYPLPDKNHYLVATGNKLILTDRNFTKDSIVFSHNHQKSPIVFIREDPFSISFTSNNELYSYNFGDGAIKKVCTLPEKILGGVNANQQGFLITYKGLYRCKSDLTTEKLVSIDKSHSVISISGSELLISSDNGLFLYNTSSKVLSTVLKGVEFNRQGLYRDGEMIYAGALYGLYSFSINDIPSLIESNKSELKKVNEDYNALLFFGIIGLLVISAVVIIYLYYKKLKKAEATIETLQTPRETMSREKIEDFISSNLPNASIKTLMDHFKVSAPLIYDALKPDRPGSIIQQLRLKTVIQMRKDNKSIEEISETTGLSVSYLKKLKSE